MCDWCARGLTYHNIEVPLSVRLLQNILWKKTGYWSIPGSGKTHGVFCSTFRKYKSGYTYFDTYIWIYYTYIWIYYTYTTCFGCTSHNTSIIIAEMIPDGTLYDAAVNFDRRHSVESDPIQLISPRKPPNPNKQLPELRDLQRELAFNNKMYAHWSEFLC